MWLEVKNLLYKYLEYFPKTGKLVWKPRVEDDFAGKKKNEHIRWNSRYAGKEAGWVSRGKGGYTTRQIKINSQTYQAHRICLLLSGVVMSCEDEVDHINGDGLDNRRENLRVCNRLVNMKNKKRYSSNTSGYVGVNWSKKTKKWEASVQVDGRRVHLGSFISSEHANEVRKAYVENLGVFSDRHGN